MHLQEMVRKRATAMAIKPYLFEPAKKGHKPTQVCTCAYTYAMIGSQYWEKGNQPSLQLLAYQYIYI